MTLRTILKRILFKGYVDIVRPLPRYWLKLRNRQRITILCYHRVNDDLRDSLTVGVGQFNEQMAWLRRYYPLISIFDVIRGNIPRNTARPLIAVTFDDGYRDNYENAVPVLLRHRIPAAFFVSTDMIGASTGFPHDLNRLGYAVPTMTWDQLRHIKQLGFTIGSHTRTHINCALGEPSEVRRELEESRTVLVRQLDLKEVIFAYPFGRREDITSLVLGMVREVGYVGCLSAYGGSNRGRINPYNILRQSIDYRFDLLSFRARLEGFDRR